ncbi:MAG TPA: hypothetical protein VK595_16445, partial [Vicinamibacterales bacterium]|nr:hypothetical protein [Vicinamibacterales bacterium]
MAAGLWTLGSALAHLAARSMNPGDPRWRQLGAPDVIGVSAVIASLALFAYTRKPDRDPRRILDLGLAYLVLTAVDLGFTFHWETMGTWHERIAPEISWIGAVVLMFAAIVPSTPVKTAIASFIAVSMNPVSMLIARARGTWNFESPSDALLMHYPDYLLV